MYNFADELIMRIRSIQNSGDAVAEVVYFDGEWCIEYEYPGGNKQFPCSAYEYKYGSPTRAYLDALNIYCPGYDVPRPTPLW